MKKPCERTKALIERYFDGELSNRQAASVEDHLADCPRCARDLASFKQLRGLVQTSFREAALRADFSALWRAIEPRLSGPKPPLWERLGVAVREYVSVYKPILAATAAAAAVASLVAVPWLVRDRVVIEAPKAVSNECIIESIESSGSTAMVYEIDADQTKVIWMFEDPEDPGEGPSSL